ncbi:MAG: acetyl-CoA C-acyltransferase [Sandaracinaceae bacterium]
MKKLDNPLSNREIWIIAAKRTAFGKMNGAFDDVSAIDLGVHASKAALAQSGLEANEIDHVVFGNVQQTSPDAIYMARHVALKSGLPIETPALTVNRLCGSGFQAVVNGAQDILLGDAKAVLVGGTENMSQAPHSMWGLRTGAKFGRPPAMVDTLWSALTDSYCNTPMAITAENLAEKYGITREQCDAFAVASQRNWAAAQESGGFKDEIAPYELKTRKGTVTVDKDEHARPDTTMETLAKLPPVFKKDGVVTAGNASGICDGAAALVIADGAWAKSRGLTPLAKLLSWGIAGVEPTLMGIGPAPAIRSALDRAGLTKEKIDWFDVNEAFAAQWLAVQKELELPSDKCNPNGGAIALGHPLAASGARITANLVYQLRRTNKALAVGSACIGGGQGIALTLERA